MPKVIKYFDELSDIKFFRQTILARIYLFVSVMFDELMLLNTQRSRGFETRDSSWSIIFYFIFFCVFENRGLRSRVSNRQEQRQYVKNLSKREQRGAICAAVSFSKRAGILSGPCALLLSKFIMTTSTSSSSVIFSNSMLSRCSRQRPSQSRRWKQNIH